MAKYEKYAEYKDSGIVWMGNVPIHWTCERFKWLLTEKLKTSNPDLPAGSISFGEVIFKNEVNLSPDTKASYQEVLKDEFLINPLNLNYDLKSLRTALSKIDVVVSTGYIVLHCDQSLDKNYVRWLLQEFDVAHMKTLGAGVRQTVNFSDIANCYFYLPDHVEQIQIANFLDHETRKIDHLIEKQQQLIELLKEKRQAVISHAVTKGLNPDVAMKDSGVEWLGEVPEHWKCIKLKHITTTFEQGWSPQCDSRPAESNEYGVLKVGCVNGGSFRSSENKALPPELEPRLQYLIQKDDLLISRANTKELVGSAAIVDDYYPNLILCDKLYRLRLSKDVLPEMVSLYLSIGVVREQIELSTTGASHSMQNIGQDTIKELYYLLPHCDEAVKILESVKKSNQHFDELTQKAESAISLMQERRTALISAAVTGKIDVRNWQAPTLAGAQTELSA